jgi:1-aminocyclopropane-1-carboxylate deaminase/D-cysteine desulfhydrase-like pyridoxal-dependent ACC family enzyme
MVIAAHVAKELGMGCSVHIPTGQTTEEMQAASAEGADLIREPHGYNNVIIARAREDVQKNGGMEIPFGMVSKAGVELTVPQAANIPREVKRIVIPVGSATNLCGLLWGCRRNAIHTPILGVVVGANPDKRLAQYAPPWWDKQLTLINSGVDYSARVDASIGNLPLDPIYEAKCLQFLRGGDLFWIIGIRNGYDVPEMVT